MSSAALWNVRGVGLHSDPDLAKGAELKLPAEGAIPLILAGRATLCEEQDAPPFELLELARQKLGYSDRVGTRILDPKVWDKIQKRAFPGGVRQYMVDGAELEWAQGWERGLFAFERRLTSEADPEANIFFELRKTLQNYVNRSHYATINRANNPRDRETDMFAAPIVCNGRKFGGPRKIIIRRDWAKLYNEHVLLMEDLEQEFGRTLREGRVLLSKGADSAAGMVGPKSAATEKYVASMTDHFFCVSDMLPRTLFSDTNTKLCNMADARKWLEDRWPGMLQTGRKITKGDAVIFIMRTFKLSKNSAQAVLESANLPERRGSGAPSAETYMDINEFNDLK